MSHAGASEEALSRLAEIHEAGGAEWREQFVSEVHRIVTDKLARQLPARLRPVFGVDDLAQETSMRLLNHVEKQQTYSDVSQAFVVIVAQRVLIDSVRHYLAQKRTPENGFMNVAPSSSANLLNHISQQAETPSQLEMGHEFWITATSLLDDKERELIELKHNEDLNYEEIAQLFGKTPQAIRSLLFRVHKKLRTELSQHPEFESFL